MRSALKYVGFFVLVVIVFSIMIKDRPVFSYIYNAISPATTYAQKKTLQLFDYTAETTETYTKKLFDNSTPRFRDSVKSRLSARKHTSDREPLDEIRREDKEQLDELIRTH